MLPSAVRCHVAAATQHRLRHAALHLRAPPSPHQRALRPPAAARSTFRQRLGTTSIPACASCCSNSGWLQREGGGSRAEPTLQLLADTRAGGMAQAQARAVRERAPGQQRCLPLAMGGRAPASSRAAHLMPLCSHTQAGRGSMARRSSRCCRGWPRWECGWVGRLWQFDAAM